MRGAQHGDDLVDMAEVVLGEDAETVADLVVEARAEVELDMDGLLLGALAVEAAARQEGRLARRLARQCRPQGWVSSRLCGRRQGHLDDRRGRGVEFDGEAFDEAHRLLAAGGAEVEARLGLQKDRVGVIGAIVAALAAVLLRHGGHQARRERPVRRHRHALGRRHGRIVPGSLVVGGEDRAGRGRGTRQVQPHACRAGQGFGRGDRPQRRGEEAGEPAPLLVGEGGGFGNEVDGRHGRLEGHASTSAASARAARARVASARSWSGSCRRAKAAKPSAGSARWSR